MKLVRFLRDTCGTAAIEFAILSTVFFALLFGILEGGYILYMDLGIQHATEMAARCASVNTTICSDATSIKDYAVSQAYGVSPPASAFTYSQTTCGNKVSGSYSYSFLGPYFWGVSSVTLTGSSCFPK
jgi:Flp pilus assembly protein TadG